jgi:polysaccharide export outer membrane protein
VRYERSGRGRDVQHVVSMKCTHKSAVCLNIGCDAGREEHGRAAFGRRCGDKRMHVASSMARRLDRGWARRNEENCWLQWRWWLAAKVVCCLTTTFVWSCGITGNIPPSSAPHRAFDNGSLQSSDKAQYSDRVADCSGSGALAKLWQERMSIQTKTDYPVGPGDLIEVSVIGVQELQDQEVRVSGDGTIAMPFVGSFFVTGMTQDELRSDVTARLKVYIKDPRVSVFVKSYASRTIAIMGLVEKPGRYVLVSPSESILQVLGQAGGITSDASENVLLVPAENRFVSADGSAERVSSCAVALNDSPNQESVASAEDYCLRGAAYRSQAAARKMASNAIEVNLNNPVDRACLSVPARPGDLVIVPQAGEVEVAGWVQKPGSIKVEPGMTVLSAVSAAGGAIFSHDAELLKTDPDGHRTQTSLNLTDIQEGRAADMPVKSGDMIYVKGSAMGAIPYSLEQLFERFGTGMMIPIP